MNKVEGYGSNHSIVGDSLEGPFGRAVVWWPGLVGARMAAASVGTVRARQLGRFRFMFGLALRLQVEDGITYAAWAL